MSDYNEYLNIAVLQENKPVTYKSLARALGIHVNKAKQALYEFSESQSNVRAVYCITGTSLKSNQFTIQLVKDAELEDAKKGYKDISGIHVYSITSFDPDDFSIFYTACKDAPQLAIEDRVKCGILKNSNVVLRNITPTNRTVDGEKKIAAATSNTKSLTSNTSTKPSTTPLSSTSKATSSTTTTTSNKRKGTLNFGPASTKKQVVTASPKSEKPISKPVAKKSINKMKPKNDQDDLDVRMAKTSIKASDIFSDDDEEEEDDQMKEPQPAEDLDIIEIDDEDEQMGVAETSKEKEPIEEEEEEPSAPAPPGKARRKVLKKRTTKNSRGHLVTEEYWDWEVVDASEVQSTTPTTPFKSKAPSSSSSSTPPAKKATNSKNAKNAKKPTGQSNLFSFFKKA